MIRLIVFDLDDTLYPEREYAVSGLRAVGEWWVSEGGDPAFARVAVRLFEQGRRGDIFNAALSELGARATPDLVASMVAVYRSHEPELGLYPDAAWALGHFRHEHQLAVITDGYLEAQQRKVHALGVEALVDAVFYTDALGREHWKPSPRAFLLAMERFGRFPSECVYVGDNPAKDFIAPNRLGWSSVRILRPGTEHGQRMPAADVPEATPGFVVGRMEGLADVLAALKEGTCR